MRKSQIVLFHARMMMMLSSYIWIMVTTTTTTNSFITAFNVVTAPTTRGLTTRQNSIARNIQRQSNSSAVYRRMISNDIFRLYAKNDNGKNIEGNVKTKLLSESIAPWRGLRLFLYVAFASGALIGGLVTLSGTAALLSGAKEGDVNTELLNLGIDFGAAAIFVALFLWDFNKQNELNTKVEEKLQLKKENQKRIQVMKERESNISNLQCSIRIGNDQFRDASIRDLQSGAKQHLIIVAGPKKACRDALVGANLLKMDFAMSNVLVVPYETEASITNLDTKPAGFGTNTDSNRPVYETQPYVAKPVGDGWYEYIQSELQDAIQQNGDKVKEEGIAIVVANTGKVVRRGVGKVPWRQMVEELQRSTVNEGTTKESSNTFFS